MDDTKRDYESPGVIQRFWRRVADSSVSLLIAVAMLAIGFMYHRQAMHNIFDFMKERLMFRLDVIERKIDDLRK